MRRDKINAFLFIMKFSFGLVNGLAWFGTKLAFGPDVPLST